MIIFWFLFTLSILALLIFGTPWWIRTYNTIIYWGTRAQKEFHSIYPLMQERLDNLYALVELVKRYNIHEYQVFKDVIEARARWSRDAEVTNQLPQITDMEYNYGKLQAVLEKYPEIKADELHKMVILRDTELEKNLRNLRVGYNYSVQRYNEIIRQFPTNLVALSHRFRELQYLRFKEQEKYQPKIMFGEN